MRVLQLIDASAWTRIKPKANSESINMKGGSILQNGISGPFQLDPRNTSRPW